MHRSPHRAFAVRATACLAVLFAVSATSWPAAAQRPAGARDISPSAVAESLKVLKSLRKALDKNSNNAAEWYHRGMLAWALYDRDRVGAGLKNIDWTLLGREADSSLRIASAIDPGNTRYQISRGQFYLGTGWIFVRIQSYHVFDMALARARESGDSLLIAEAAVEKGRVHWRRYDPSDFGSVPADVRQQARAMAGAAASSNSLLTGDLDSQRELAPTQESLSAARHSLMSRFQRSDGGFTHEADYVRAEAFFREAYASAPSYTRGYQQLAMLLADRERWTELSSIARQRIAQSPRDAWAWMTLGLSALRSGNQPHALTAFDSGLRLLPPADRQRLDNIARVLPPSDSAMVANWSPAKRTDFERTYWDWSAPLWSREETRPRAEFLARVTYAELRWTVDELQKRGSDSDRGMVHIRYGPADGRLGNQGGETWTYDYLRLVFTFHGAPTFGTAYFADADYALDIMDSVPARWDNVTHVHVDSLPVRYARFRASDSVDVVFSSFPPVDAIRTSAAIDGPVQTDFWLFDATASAAIHDSGGTRANNPRSFTKRLAPGSYFYRFEASEDGSMRAARAAAPFTALDDPDSGFLLHGFAISDILLASRAAPRGPALRWRDFDFDASAGSLAQGANLALIWENYDLGERNGGADYSIAITLERKYMQFLNRVRARVIAAFAAAMGTEQTADRVVFHYDRKAAHAAVIADYVNIALEDTPAGNYDVTLDITDNVTGKTTSRTVRVVIHE